MGLICTCCVIQAFQTTAVSQTMYKVDASDPNIQYTGRIDNANPDNVGFSHPGVSIKAKFQGTAIDAIIKEYGSGGATTTNYFNVIIDRVIQPEKLRLSKSQTTYQLARGLAEGEHTIELFKLTESSVGKVEFQGFQLETGKTLVTPDPLPSRKIEFIGNSLTCGYGNEVSYTKEELDIIKGFNSVNENNYKAWGAITARNLNAQYSCVAYSGRGIYRNNTGTTTGILPSIYDRILPDNATPLWDHAKYTPHVIVINLGTNDFEAEANGKGVVDPTAFIDTYISFINKLKGYYPDATIICAVGVGTSDYWPMGAWTRTQQYVSAVKKHFVDNGDSKVHYFKMEPQVPPCGEDWHPTVAKHLEMATELTAFINSLPESTWDTPSQLTSTVSNKSKMTVTPESVALFSENQIAAVDLIDMQGTIISTQKVQDKSVKIPITSLPKGTYLARIIYAGEHSETVKFVK